MRFPLAALVASGLCASGCVEEDAAMFIEGVLPLTVENSCAVSAGDAVFQSSGTLDLAAASGGYTAFLKVRTNLPATFNSTDVATDKAGSPNYRNYGPVDNNVVIFESAAVDFILASDADTVDVLSTAAGQVGGAADQFNCSGGQCTTTGKPEIVPAAGSVFNVQTSLNTPQVIVSEVLSGNTARTLLAIFEAAADIAGQDADNLNLLTLPGQRQRVTLNVALTGKTTGAGDLRPVTSAPFPFGVDLCIGCLAPSAAQCRAFEAVPIGTRNADGDPATACIAGQDIPTAACACVDANGDPTDIVTNDATVCQPAP